jgi:hypothetical protein
MEYFTGKSFISSILARSVQIGDPQLADSMDLTQIDLNIFASPVLATDY